jgi:hypothetical protein
MQPGASMEWRDITYAETLEQELRGLERRMQSDPACTLADIEGMLRNVYIMEGADWIGRGDVQDAVMSATIAAYEQFIAARKAR